MDRSIFWRVQERCHHLYHHFPDHPSSSVSSFSRERWAAGLSLHSLSPNPTLAALEDDMADGFLATRRTIDWVDGAADDAMLVLIDLLSVISFGDKDSIRRFYDSMIHSFIL